MGGLDAAGKTTILYSSLRVGDVRYSIPFIPLTLETCEWHGFAFSVHDFGGRHVARIIWKYVFEDGDCLVWVMDSVDTFRMNQSLDELKISMGRMAELTGKSDFPVLLLCNKQDLPGALSVDTILKRFGGVPDSRPFLAVGCSAIQGGENVRFGFDWLRKTLVERKAKVKSPPETDTLSEGVKLDYAPTFEGGNRTLMNFAPIKNGTECPFAKAAKIWGGRPYYDEPGVPLETQAAGNAAGLTEFCRRIVNEKEKLDGFCIELQDPLATHSSPQGLGVCVRRLLTVLSNQDPANENTTSKSYLGNRGWRFRFAAVDFFITTFAPCYPKTHSRYAFGTGRVFVLFQPYTSFDRLAADTPHTAWDEPQTMRDKARVAYRDAGRSYHIPDTVHYPAAEHMVKPLKDDGNTVIRWWDA